MENGHRNSGFSHEKWVDLSIAMLVYQRVCAYTVYVRYLSMSSRWATSQEPRVSFGAVRSDAQFSVNSVTRGEEVIASDRVTVYGTQITN